jgi:hypothetical protein
MPAPIHATRIRVSFAAALVCVCALSSLVAAPAHAARIFRGDHLIVAEPDTIHDDVYAFGGDVTVRGVVDGDVVACGGKVRVEGNVTGSVLAAGGDIDVSGNVAGSIRAAGGDLKFEAHTEHDLVAAGGRVSLESEGSVGRDVMMGCGKGTIDGPVARDVRAGVGQLTVGSRANIGGDLTYMSERSMVRESGAVVRGKTTWYAEEPGMKRRSHFERIMARVVHHVRSAVGVLILGLLYILLFPGFAQRTLERLAMQPLPSTGSGLLSVVVIPVAAVTIMIIGFLIGGWWIGAALLVGCLFAMALGNAIASMTLGRWLGARMGQAGLSLGWSLAVGVAVLMILGLIPILGSLVSFLVMLAGLGALMLSIGSAVSAGRARGARAA